MVQNLWNRTPTQESSNSRHFESVENMNESYEALKLIGRTEELFISDLADKEEALSDIVKRSSFLVLGGAGTIGQAVTKEIFSRNPKKLHVVDVSENNLVELVRDLRSSYGYIDGDFRTFALDIGAIEYDAFYESDGRYDFVLNLSALKHVRSEKDPYTLMRMVEVNIFNTDKTISQAIESGVTKYFCVSTDKAANPVNMMGASKRIMEMYLNHRSRDISISTARFANVAFSNGSLLYSFNQRLAKRQPIVAPNDVRRYFVTSKESGILCLMSCIFGENREIFFPKLKEQSHLLSFSEIAQNYLRARGYTPKLCESEAQARSLMRTLPQAGHWPCLFTPSDTTGEKAYEEFFTMNETVNLEKFSGIGIVENRMYTKPEKLENFQHNIKTLQRNLKWEKRQILSAFQELLPEFTLLDTGKYLDGKM